MKTKTHFYLMMALFFLNFCEAQQKRRSALIADEIEVTGKEVYHNGDQWAFVNKIYSDVNLEKDTYEYDSQFGEWELLPDVTNEPGAKKVYYLFRVYQFTAFTNFQWIKTIISKNPVLPSPWETPAFSRFPENMPVKTFDCNSGDLIPESIIHTANISGLKIAMEDIGDNIDVGIFTKKCMLYGILETPKTIFSYYETKDYFIVKSDKLFLFYAPGSGIGD